MIRALFRRRIVLVLVALLIVLVVSAELLRRYASSKLVAGLEEIYGGRIEADDARVGWISTTLRGARFYEADGEHAVLSIDELSTDLSLWDLIAERLPEHLVLTKPALTLRFDEHRQLLTKLPSSDAEPGELPGRIALEQASVIIEQVGRPSAEISGVNAELIPQDGTLAITAEVDDPTWGQWTAQGQLALATGEGSLQAASRQLNVSPDLLHKLPLVPPQIWSQVAADGPVSAKISLNLKPPAAPDFRAEVQLAETNVFLSALDVQLTGVHGALTITEAGAAFRDLRAAFAEGSLTAAGQLHFRDPPELELGLKLSGVDVAQLPASWPKLDGVEGRLNGTAEFGVVLDENSLRVAGEASATIVESAIQEVPLEPIAIEVYSGQQRLADKSRRELSGEITLEARLPDAPVGPLLRIVPRPDDTRLPAVAGAVSADLSVTIPLATATDWTTYRASGSFGSRELTVEGIALTNAQAQAAFSGNVLAIDTFEAAIPTAEPDVIGQIAGTARVGLGPDDEIALQLAVDDAPLELLARFVESDDVPQGLASLDVIASAPRTAAQELSAWNVDGRISIPRVELQERQFTDVAADISTREGKLHLLKATATAGDVPLTGAAAIDLASPFAYEARLDVPETDVGVLSALANVEPPIDVAGTLKGAVHLTGSLSPLTWTADGVAFTKDLHLEQWIIDAADFAWSANPRQLRLTDVAASAYLGKITGEVTMPLDDPSGIVASGEFSNIRLEDLPTEHLPPPELTGGVNGTFALSGSDLKTGVADVTLESAALDAGSVTLEEVSVRLALRRGELEYETAASALRGDLSAAGTLTFGDENWKEMTGSGEFQAEGLRLSQLREVLGAKSALPVEGLASLQFSYTHEGLEPKGRGRALIRNLQWNERELTRTVEGEVLLSGRELRLPQIVAELGDGSVRASLSLDLAQLDRGSYSLALDRVSPADVLWAWPEVADQIDGAFDARLRGSLGRQISGSGTLAMAQGTIAGLEVTGVRLPLHFVHTPAEGRGELQISESTIQAARGRVIGQAGLTWGRGLQLASKMKLVGLELQSVAGSGGSMAELGSGRISGNAAFTAQNLRTASDLTGAFDLTLTQAQAFQYPVLRNVARYVTPVSPSSITFNRGEVRGRLARGVVQIQRLALVGSDTRLLADGAINLQGRVNLDMTIQRGEPLTTASALRRIALRVIQAETVPLTLLTQANTLLSDRLIFLHVGGTVGSPSIQIRPAPQLQQEALRFFLGQALGGPG